MIISRRELLAGAAVAAAGTRVTEASPPHAPGPAPRQSLDPWLEIDAAALAHNVAAVSTMAGGRPIIAVVKNNAYGLGLETAGRLLAMQERVFGLGVVRASEAHALRAGGVREPGVLMGPATDEEALERARADVRLAPYTTDEEALELARADVRLAPYAEADRARWLRMASRLGRPVGVHLYVDTGMHRMGMPHDLVLPWLDDAPLRRALRIEGAFTELTEDNDFDIEHAGRPRSPAGRPRAAGVALGRLHATSSDAIVRPTAETFLDLLRPGLALYGGYPTEESRTRGGLRPAYRLKARVIRLDRLAPGEGVSYHRRYTASEPTVTATLGIGHVDGYPAGAVKGCEVLIRERLHPVIGTVSASHTVVALAAESRVEVGDGVTLVGPDRPSLHPHEVAARRRTGERRGGE